MHPAPDSSHFLKAGQQSADDPLKFILSTDTIDRMGDIVEQDWQLSHFKKNPIALFMHNHNAPIGVWKNVKVEGGKLVGTLALAKAGTSELIDTIRSLVEQRILKAVSVGFSVAGYEARYDDDGNFKGYNLKKPSLHETSLVSVPANQEALQIAKSYNLSDNDIKSVFCTDSKAVETDPLLNHKNRLSLVKLGAR